MNSDRKLLIDTIIRAIVVAGVVSFFSIIVFGAAALEPQLAQFELLKNGVTIAIAYAAFKGNRLRDGFAALLLWYVLLTAVIDVPYHAWNFVMEAAYIVGLTYSIYFYFNVVGKTLGKARVKWIIAATLIVGTAHGLIFIFLQIISLRVFAHPIETFEWSFIDLKNGLVIGILSALGMEFSEYVVRTIRSLEKINN
ncbi:MAG: hypothetical protein ACLP05_11300 [Candidatus Kryptoniota bacterium]